MMHQLLSPSSAMPGQYNQPRLPRQARCLMTYSPWQCRAATLSVALLLIAWGPCCAPSGTRPMPPSHALHASSLPQGLLGQPRQAVSHTVLCSAMSPAPAEPCRPPAVRGGCGCPAAAASLQRLAYRGGRNWRTSRKASRSVWYSTTPTLAWALMISQLRVAPGGRCEGGGGGGKGVLPQQPCGNGGNPL